MGSLQIGQHLKRNLKEHFLPLIDDPQNRILTLSRHLSRKREKQCGRFHQGLLGGSWVDRSRRYKSPNDYGDYGL